MGIVSKVPELLYVLFDGFAALSPWERILMHAPLLLTILAPTL
jgi:hypothetical protein